jgi:hypothetical protein
MILLLTAYAYSALTAGTVLLAARRLAVPGLILPAHLHSRRLRRVRRGIHQSPRPSMRG